MSPLATHLVRPAVAFAALATLAAVTGCDSKIAQCNRLIDVINKEQAPLKKETGNEPKALQELASTLDDVSAKVKAVQVEDAKLVEFRDQYATMASDLAVASRETAKAIESKDSAVAREAAKKMSSFSPRESELVNSINNYCSGSP